ncbi:cyanoexosortase A system-associated protein [Phormidium sp. CCY1219]|uniref:cyanoexosortase A system-associated protein n=1 Tax=Phormidium sp. CCY1219 TaxID=2886104 RepID=UPI002D1F8464|nr:cyanoexosortase A system-associated protein [Phormidium sp. CCY1219]MEB3828724.1 cyanoexosortase A system-associated protein [Phormidium sp. CCY1219]
MLIPKKLHWKSVRIVLLAATLGGAIAVLGKLIFSPPIESAGFTPFVFPTAVPLADWQFEESLPLEVNENESLISGGQYFYIQNNLPLEIQMRYVTNTGGNVEKLMQTHLDIEASAAKLTIRHQEEIGFYGVSETGEQAYLASCINPRGGSTVSGEQFRKNRNAYDLQVDRLLPWLLGQQKLRDFRCMLTVLSIPLDKNSPENSYSILESVWVSWYRWWQPRFPPS